VRYICVENLGSRVKETDKHVARVRDGINACILD